MCVWHQSDEKTENILHTFRDKWNSIAWMTNKICAYILSTCILCRSVVYPLISKQSSKSLLTPIYTYGAVSIHCSNQYKHKMLYWIIKSLRNIVYLTDEWNSAEIRSVNSRWKTERKQFHLKISIRVYSVYAPSLNTCFGRNAYFIAGIGADSCEYMEVVSNFIAQSWSYRAKMASEIHSTHIMDRIRWMDGWRGRGVKSTWLTRLSASAVVSLCAQSSVICGWRRTVRG